MADDIRQRIISSVFSKRSATGTVEEQYIAHVKIFEEAGPNAPVGPEDAGKKARYILLALSRQGPARVHKSKMNSNGSFSIGKTWELQDLKSIEVVNRLTFNISFARLYRWQTENAEEQEAFINATVKLYRRVSNGRSPQLMGITVPERSAASTASRSSAATEDDSRAKSWVSIPPVPLPGRRPQLSGTSVGSNDSVPRSVSPSLYTPRQAMGFKSTSPSSRNAMLTSTNGQASGDSGKGRPSLDLPNGSRRTPSPGPSPATPFIMGGSPRGPARSPMQPSPRMGDPPSRETSSTSSRDLQSTPGRSRARGDGSSNDWDRPGENGIPQTPRQNLRDRTVSPPPNRGLPSTSVPSRGLGNSRSERAPSPVYEAPSPVYEGITFESQPPQRSRAGSRSEASRPIERPTERPVEGSMSRSRAGSLAKRSASPAPARARPDVVDPRDVPSLPSTNQQPKKDPYARISFFDPANQVSADGLLASTDKSTTEEESVEATMANVEEMLEGYEWAIGGWGASKGAADQIEARLLKELGALEAANMYSFVETDDRVKTVLDFIDEALKELEEMDGLTTSYKIHLNAVSDDISYIQSQNRGLQVQTQNQRTLLKELEGLLQTVDVDPDALALLNNGSLEKQSVTPLLEEAAAELYKALLAGQDTDMAATMERLAEYRTHNAQFCKRLTDFLPVMIQFQADSILKSGDKSKGKSSSASLVITSRGPMNQYLARYAGLIRFVKEMDEPRYSKLCGYYFSASSDLYRDQVKLLLQSFATIVRKAPEDEADINFGNTSAALSRGATMRRAGTIVRSPLDLRNKDKDKDKDGEIRGYEAFGRILEQVTPLIYQEANFISNFLQINDFGETYADYMKLDNYFRRQAMRTVGLSQQTQKLIRGAMDLIFGFLPAELKGWIEGVLVKDNLQMVGITAHLERYILDAEERSNIFLAKLLQKLHQKMVVLHHRHVDEQIKSIEQTKLSQKKRKGVAQFIKYFPVFVGRTESQLAGADSLEIRTLVDTAYEQIVTSMFDSLQQIAKLDGEGEDKGQLAYHATIIDNMHTFIGDLTQQNVAAVTTFTRRAEALYEENLSSYVKLLLRRPFSRLLDFLEGAEKLLRAGSAAEVSANASYNKAQLKKVLKEYSAKDVRRHVDSLYKRMEKHFAESEDANGAGGAADGPGTVIFGVWKACEAETIAITDRFTQLLSTCYKDSSMEYSVADVESSFKKHRA